MSKNPPPPFVDWSCTSSVSPFLLVDDKNQLSSNMPYIPGISSVGLLSVLYVGGISDVTAFAPLTLIPQQHHADLASPLRMAEPIKITMPALSSTMKEGRVVSWLKSEGDAIEAGDAIMVVESDKADMDVEAFEDGFLAKILTGEGESAEVGAPVALVAASEDEIQVSPHVETSCSFALSQ